MESLSTLRQFFEVAKLPPNSIQDCTKSCIELGGKESGGSNRVIAIHTLKTAQSLKFFFIPHSIIFLVSYMWELLLRNTLVIYQPSSINQSIQYNGIGFLKKMKLFNILKRIHSHWICDQCTSKCTSRKKVNRGGKK